MIRALYCGLLWLHPSSFQQRFGEELLWIFDIRPVSGSSVSLLLDGLISLFRQWLFRSDLWKFGIGVLMNLILGHRLLFGV